MKFNIKQLKPIQKKLRKDLLLTAYTNYLSHIGSSLSILDLVYAIYKIKKPKEKFVLSNGHAAIGLYTILKHKKFIQQSQIEKLNVHPDRNRQFKIDVSTGSLGQGLPIAIGIALANLNKNTYCIISDGECTEGSIWESLKIVAEKNIKNLKVILSYNGWSAYDLINLNPLKKRIRGFGFQLITINGHNLKQINLALKEKMIQPTIIFAKTNSEQFPFLKGIDAHYCKVSKEDYKSSQNLLK